MTDMWVARSSAEGREGRSARPGAARHHPDAATAAAAGRPARLFGEGEAEFLGKVLHDLRGGVGSIVIHSATLADNTEHLSAAELKRELDRLAEHGDRLHQLMERLLDVTHVVGRRIEPQPVRLAALVQRLLDAEPWAADHEVSIRIADDLEIVTDPVSLDQILSNLLRNARVHGGSAIEVEATLTDDAARLTVSDNGPGVPAAQLDSLFDPFTSGTSGPSRVPGAARPSGWGLGLAIVAELVEGLDGDVAYQPNAPSGARFHVTLPT